jgi:hypothetical protein
MAGMATAEIKVADAEPVRALLDAMAQAVAEFVKLGSEETVTLPEPARTGISVLLAAAGDFTPGRREPVPPLPSRLRCPGCLRRWDKIYKDGRNCVCESS